MSRTIVFLVSSMTTGGAERVAATLANAWTERGDRVILVMTYSGVGECHYPLAGGVELRRLSTELGAIGRHPWTYIRRFIALRRIIQAEGADVVVSFLTPVNIAGLLATVGMRTPVIVSERVYPPLMRQGRLIESLRRWVYPRAASVVMQTTLGADWLAQHIPGANATVIPNPVPYPLAGSEPTLAPESLVSVGRNLLLAVGRLSEQKGFDLLLQAFTAVCDEHPLWDLVIVGEGPLLSSLKQQVRVLGLERRAYLVGRVGNLADWYERADLYVMSSRFEGFPNTLAEAMAHGCPVVSYDCDTGPRDLVRDGVDGVLVRPAADVGALAAALGRLIEETALRAQMAENAADVRERYALERILQQWNCLFQRVVRKPKQPASVASKPV
jgi:GalNAc-alpha-(1->4)-GalNAc-alpha-(1->3)-diNAcBac-PP-undecaprenol alpha-1,4-N-acetyl-D-galactosaminyltransferase